MKHALSTQHLSSKAFLLGGMTLVSRVLGFARDIMIAFFFGTGIYAEAFVVSFKIPNLFRDLAGEGAVNSAVIPVLADAKQKSDKEDLQRFLSALFNNFLVLLVILVFTGMLFSDQVVSLIAPGFVNDPNKFEITSTLTKFLFPYLLLIGISALFMGILNSHHQYASSSLGPIVLNVMMILSLIFLVPRFGVQGLVLGILAGGVLQCVIQIPGLRGLGFSHSFFIFSHHRVKEVVGLLLPRIWGSAVYQTSVFVDTILASLTWIVGLGGQSALYYASRLFQLPLAIFGVSFAQAGLVQMSQIHSKDDMKSLSNSIIFALKQVFFLTYPCCLGFLFYSRQIIEVLFEKGRFDEYSTDITSSALFCYSIGLIACAWIKVVTSAFYAFKDTKTPVKAAGIGLIANIVLNFVLMGPFKIAGLALATSISSMINVSFLFNRLEKKVHFFKAGELFAEFKNPLIASLPMIIFNVFSLFFWNGYQLSQEYAVSKISQIIFLIICIGLSALFYFGMHWLMKTDEITHWLKRNEK